LDHRTGKNERNLAYLTLFQHLSSDTRVKKHFGLDRLLDQLMAIFMDKEVQDPEQLKLLVLVKP
jgi:hypothetical protein